MMDHRDESVAEKSVFSFLSFIGWLSKDFHKKKEQMNF